MITIKANRKPPTPAEDDTSVPAADSPAALDEPRARRMSSEKAVLAIIPVARSTLWRWETKGSFPKGIPVEGRTFYYEAEIAAWQLAMEGRQIGRRRRSRAKTS